VRIVFAISIGLTILWLVGQLIGFGVGILWARRRSRRVFERRLRRSGLSGEVIEELVGRYHPPGLFRDLIREVCT